MKITCDIDCTPEEARAFFGLPDVRPMQAELLKHMQERMIAALQATSPEAMLKNWFPTTFKGFEQWQEMFRSQTPTGKQPEK